MIPIQTKKLLYCAFVFIVALFLTISTIPKHRTEAKETNQINQTIKKTTNINQKSKTKNQSIEPTNESILVQEHQTTEPKPVPIQRTDGFNIENQHFDIQWFSGDGQVPTDNYIYHWNDDEIFNHYLVERKGAAGSLIWSIHVGSKIVVDNHTYTRYKILNHIDRLNGFEQLVAEQANLSVQTCETDVPNSLLTIWFFT